MRLHTIYIKKESTIHTLALGSSEIILEGRDANLAILKIVGNSALNYSMGSWGGISPECTLNNNERLRQSDGQGCLRYKRS